MISDALDILATWKLWDTWIVITAVIAAMSCALPGNYLLLRRQSMMGDAISHTVLPGIVIAFLFAHWLKTSGWISAETYDATRHTAMFLGAMVLGVVSAMLTEWVQRHGQVESSAALGVVFTTLFAVGLLLIRVAADSVHIDPDCVLFGMIETAVMDLGYGGPWLLGHARGGNGIPRAVIVNGIMLLANAGLVIVFFKELRISAFDPALATVLGINARVMHYALMAVTAATLVAAFESVGSILVIAMLIVPAATAHLLTDRLSTMLILSLLVAAASAVLGHVLALTVPPVILTRLGFESLREVSASTSGMMAVASGLIFVTVMILGPRYGILSKLIHRGLLSLRIASEDILGMLYRFEESAAGGTADPVPLESILGVNRFMSHFALLRLKWARKVERVADGYRLTESGRQQAQSLVRSHRLWESYMAKHFPLPGDHLHETAARVEHYLNPEMMRELESELGGLQKDPHGRVIPKDAE